MIHFIQKIFDFILHIDTHLVELMNNYGTVTYIILFCVVFAETGLVIAPFLPGDSLFFAAGALCASGAMNVWGLIGICIIAAILGNTINYEIGVKLGPTFYKNNFKLIKKENLEKTQAFYEKHGGRAIIFSRFLPIFRTFVPFVAGIAQMNRYKHFIYNVVGAFLWVPTFVFAGYLLGQNEFVKNNFSIVIIFILFITSIPPIITYFQNRK